jgi:hypothetical protein
MSTEHLLREFYNQMYRVHTQPDNVYDLGDHLHHLTVHKHLDRDPFIQFREACRRNSHPITSHDDALASRVRIVKYLIAILTINQKGPVSRAAGRTLNLIGYTDHNIPD